MSLPKTSSSMPSSLPPVAANPPPFWSHEAAQVAASTSTGQQQLAISNGVLLAAVIFLFMVVVFVFLLYLYAKRYLGANPLLAPGSNPSSRFLFVAASPLPTRGLPAAALRSLPVTVYAAPTSPTAASPTGKDKDRLECAVCLSEVADGEKVRALPKCGHAFHVECIDMWFHSHDTCPLCRAPVAAADDLAALPREDPSSNAVEFPVVFPTNVLFWGTHDDGVANAGLSTIPPPPPLHPFIAGTSSASASASGRRKENLVIDIPARGVAISTPPMNSPLPASRMAGSGGADEMWSPVSARLRSLHRLLSRGKQAVVGTSYSPRAGGGDIEQGLAGTEAARPPKTPKTPKTPPSAN